MTASLNNLIWGMLVIDSVSGSEFQSLVLNRIKEFK